MPSYNLPTAEIAARYQTGWSIMDLTFEYRVGHKRIKDELAAAGVPIRPKATRHTNPHASAGHVRRGYPQAIRG
jgi:hypothetical protein